jgi:hypothetical protein
MVKGLTKMQRLASSFLLKVSRDMKTKKFVASFEKWKAHTKPL